MILLCACKTVNAPRGTLPMRKEIAMDAYGGWIELALTSDPKPVQGELIVVSTDSVYVMETNYVNGYAKGDISSARVIFFNTAVKDYTTWAVLWPFVTISNGGFLFITLPLTLIAGINTSHAEATRVNYIDYPENGFEEFKKYARFPQGKIEAINLEALEPRD